MAEAPKDAPKAEATPVAPVPTAPKPAASAAPAKDDKPKTAKDAAAAVPADATAKDIVDSTPETSDVPPLYIAIVSPDDPNAVMQVVALTPENNQSTNPMTFKREKGAWTKDEQILRDLKSATPPPVVPLDATVLDDVLKQVDKASPSVTASGLIPIFDLSNLDKEDDEVFVVDAIIASVVSGNKDFYEISFGDNIFETLSADEYALLESEGLLSEFSIQAAGGLDRNRGNAEDLRQYWTHGKGAAKIRWGTPGDWTRCVRHLSKYMGVRAKGYCQLRHKDALGFYTGTHAKMDRAKQNLSSEEEFTNKVIEKAYLTATANEARSRMSLTAAAPATTDFGAKFSIPLVLPEEVESGDGRSFLPNSVEIREFPLPLMWQFKTGDGHSGSVVVGRIDYMERIDGGIGNAVGVFDNGEHGKEAERLVRNGFLRGVSADLDQFEAKESKSKTDLVDDGDEDAEEMGKKKLSISHARVMGVTIVPKPAFQECLIILDEADNKEESVETQDGVYEETVEAPAEQLAITASGFLKSIIPAVPPKDWFVNPALDKPTPLTIGDDGRVFGHIAAWHVNHIGMPNATKPPKSRSNYAYFHTGLVRTDAGADMPVGQLTLAGGHASLHASAAAAAKHYDDTASAIADVHAGEDRHGIWVAGSLRPDATEAQIRALRASAPSGDWRPVAGSLELVAVCQVNVPGFPIARALVASGSVMALVAAGAYEMAMLRNDAAGRLSAKARALGALSASVEELSIRERVEAKRIDSEFGYIPRADREEMAKKGQALPDGSFPIKSAEDVRAAVHAYGRAKESNRAKVRKHIMKRARSLKVAHMIPEEWLSASSTEAAFAINSMRSKIASLTAAVPVPIEISDTDIQKLADAKQAADVEQEQIATEIEARKAAQENPAAIPETDPNTGLPKFIPGKTQPRDATGQFRKVLARLKQDLGVAGLQEALKQVEQTENLEFAGNYTQAAESAGDLLNTIDRLDSGALDATKLENVRTTAADLGKVIANLPLPFNNQAQKVKFSDLPPALKKLMDDMITRVETKIGKKDAGAATSELKSYMSGGDLYSQSEISSKMATLLRLLT